MSAVVLNDVCDDVFWKNVKDLLGLPSGDDVVRWRLRPVGLLGRWTMDKVLVC